MQKAECEKNSGNQFLGHQGEFFIFSQPFTGSWGCPQYFPEFLQIMLQNLAQALCNV